MKDLVCYVSDQEKFVQELIDHGHVDEEGRPSIWTTITPINAR